MRELSTEEITFITGAAALTSKGAVVRPPMAPISAVLPERARMPLPSPDPLPMPVPYLSDI